MKSSLVFVAFVALCPSAGLAADKTDWNGYWWTSMTLDFKLGWVTGYAKAMNFADTSQMLTCGLNIPLYKQKFPTLDPKDIFQKMCASNTELDYAGISMGQFVDGMDAFYKDYRNKQLEVGRAIQHVRDEIKGKPAKELDAEVAIWRRCSAALQAGDTDQIAKACTPPNPDASPKK